MTTRQRLATGRKRVLRSRRRRRHEAYRVRPRCRGQRGSRWHSESGGRAIESRNDRHAGVCGIKISADRTETPEWLGVEVPPGSENTAERQRAQRKHGRSRARLPRSKAGEGKAGPAEQPPGAFGATAAGSERNNAVCGRNRRSRQPRPTERRTGSLSVSIVPRESRGTQTLGTRGVGKGDARTEQRAEKHERHTEAESACQRYRHR